MTDQWTFVWAAYALTLFLSAAVLVWAYGSMRSAERRADALRRNRD